MRSTYDVIVIGGGHAGAEAAWAAANALEAQLPAGQGEVLLITMDPLKTGAMSCNPCIGGLAKGQCVREVDALGGLMGLAADATGIQFRMLNASKGPAVHGPRCQSDKYAYAREVRRLLATRENLTHEQGLVEDFIVEEGPDGKYCAGIVARVPPEGDPRSNRAAMGADCCAGPCAASRFVPASVALSDQWERKEIRAKAVVLTTGTFMRAIMHTGPEQTKGGRVDEGTADGISGALTRLGFDLHRLKTGTPPRLAAQTVDFSHLKPQAGDAIPQPFSEMTLRATFPRMPQVDCHETHTDEALHEMMRANLDKAPMYNGQIASSGPRYCPSFEDKVVRFADKHSHHVYLEPESLESNEIYCNGISTSMPKEVQEQVIRRLPGCENAKVLRWGYAVEYDAVRGHQLDATCQSKVLPGLFTAGQLNGTSGYEEAAAQGLLAGLNAARLRLGKPLVRLGREQAYIGVMMDDLVTKVPVEPYRLFTSRAEWRLHLRSDNADERLTGLGRQWGLVCDQRWRIFNEKREAKANLRELFKSIKVDVISESGEKKRISLAQWASRPEVTLDEVMEKVGTAAIRVEETEAESETRRAAASTLFSPAVVSAVWSENLYAGFLARQEAEVARLRADEHTELPAGMDFSNIPGLRTEAQLRLAKFRPATLGQAGRLEGVNPTDVMVISVWLGKLKKSKPA